MMVVDQHNKAKRWRPRFSVSTLVVVVTLVCCYAACWGPTKTHGARDVHHYWSMSQQLSINAFSPRHSSYSASLPLVVGVDHSQRNGDVLKYDEIDVRRHDYFWFFGYVAKLPFEREI